MHPEEFDFVLFAISPSLVTVVILIVRDTRGEMGDSAYPSIPFLSWRAVRFEAATSAAALSRASIHLLNLSSGEIGWDGGKEPRCVGFVLQSPVN